MGRPGPSSSEPDPPEAAIAALYAAELPRLLRLAALFVNDRAAAEDAVHDAFAMLQQRWHRLDDQAAAAAYVSVAVANNARSMLRRRKVATRWLAAIRPEHLEGADAPVLLAAEHQAVVDAVRLLPPRQQQVVALRFWHGLSEAQIAEAMGISRGTVRSNATRGLAKVHSHLQNLENDDA